MNSDVPGQMVFVDGVTAQFSGHEPDARTTNPQTWINQAFSGADSSLWYHPNDAGHTAYAELLLAHGTWGAPTHSTAQAAVPTPPVTGRPTATLRVRVPDRRVSPGHTVTLRVAVRLSDGTAPTGRIVVRQAGKDRMLVRRALRASADGRVRVRVTAR